MAKIDFDAKLQDISKRITSNTSKHILVENELKSLQKFDSSYFRGRSCFEEDGVQKDDTEIKNFEKLKYKITNNNDVLLDDSCDPDINFF